MKRLRIFSLLLATAMLLLLSGCSLTIDRSESQEVKDLLDEEDESGGESSYALSTGATLSAETLIDDNGLIVRVTGLSGELNHPRINMAFDKGASDSIWFDLSYALVNGWQVSATVQSPDDAYLTFHNYSSQYSRFSGYVSLPVSTMVEYGLMTDVYTVEFDYVIHGEYSSETYEGVYSATTSADGVPEEYVCDGLVLMDAEDVTVQFFSVEEGYYYPMPVLYLENHSDRRVTVTAAAVDAEPEDAYAYPMLSTDVIPDARRLSGLGGGAYIDENGRLTFTLNIYDYDAYEAYNPYNEDEELPVPLASETISLTVGDGSETLSEQP